MTRAYRITPEDLAVDQVVTDGSRESILALLDASDLELRPLSDDALIISSPHSFSTVVEGDQAWSLLGSETFTAGPALILGLNQDGSFRDPPMEMGELMHAVRFRQIKGREQVALGTRMIDDHGLCQVYGFKLILDDAVPEAAPAQSIEPPEPKPPVGRLAWTVYKDADGYSAVGFFIGGPRDGDRVKLENETYEGLRDILPTGLTAIPRSDTDADDIVETLI